MPGSGQRRLPRNTRTTGCLGVSSSCAVSLPHAASVVSDIAAAAASAMPRVIFMVSPLLLVVVLLSYVSSCFSVMKIDMCRLLFRNVSTMAADWRFSIRQSPSSLRLQRLHLLSNRFDYGYGNPSAFHGHTPTVFFSHVTNFGNGTSTMHDRSGQLHQSLDVAMLIDGVDQQIHSLRT